MVILMEFNELREKYPQFIYESFEILPEDGKLKIYFNFSLGDIKFRPEVTFPDISKKRLEDIDTKALSNLVFNLGLVEMISYWKATCSPEIIIRAGYLNTDQITWWKDLLIKGLGEFFYQNQINFAKEDLVKITVDSDRHFPVFNEHLHDRSLILVGGGKDSAVTLEKLLGKNDICLLLNPTQAAKAIAEVGGCESPLYIGRKIDPKLLELNSQGYLNGHTPFSAYLAFLSTLATALYDYKNIVVSNESGSSEGNVEFHGQIVNHQYSKSFEFEKKFRNYCQKYLSAQTNYYSYLRNLNELEIARQFAAMEKYHQIFRSCNRGSKMGGIWCGECSKCLFAYLILYPFLGDKLKEIFGKDLLNDKNLTPIMEELLQMPGKFKPFECVGTKEEVEYALFLSVLKSAPKIPELVKKYQDKISILILGFGREGQASYLFLKKYFSEDQIGTVDQKDGKNYLDKIKSYDIIIKSPGIPYLPEIITAKEDGKIITTSTQIFFDIFPGQIIGVTGTKGKSTTASLIYEVLKSGGLSVYLAGNIGKPALDILADLKEDDIVVYELSSFQLADLTKSPHVAVITNIYQDHLDWHGSLENYRSAKENIFKYQGEGDFLIRDKSGAEAAKEVAKMFNIPEEIVDRAITNFKPLPHRLEFVAEKNGIKFYNDSLATNPHATIHGLKILGDEVETLIAGGFDRGVDYSILGPIIANSQIKNLILFPVTGEKIRQAVQNAGGTQEKFDVDSMEEAVKKAFKVTSPGKICLMSPASASFNMFKDYADRGEQFKKLVIAH